MAAVFFCSVGLIYNGSASAAEGAAESNRPPTVANQPASNPGRNVLDPPPPASDTALPAGQSVKVGSFGQVDLHVKDLDLSMVLQLLSIQSQRNIVASRNVSGKITADLYNVDFYEALDAVLHPNGFGYREKGNFIYVYTQQELEAMAKAELRMVLRVVRLNYLAADEVKSFLDPLVSSAGSITSNSAAASGFQPTVSDGGANSRADADVLVIRDYPDNVQQIVDVIKELDVRPKQVLVEATILRARLTEDNAFGVDLTILGDIALDKFTSPLGAVDELISGAVKETRVGGATTSVGQTLDGGSGVKVGIVTHSISAFIRALDEVTDTTVMANPKILVLNRQRADLHVGQRLGYLSSTSTETSTTQTVEFLEVGTQLTLRPFVSDDGFIRMELRPSLSDGDTRSVGTGTGTFIIPDEITQQITTNVMVKNGQTIVLGGLFKEDTTVSRKQVPVLGDVPVLGLAFKGHDDTVRREEVIFLITPTIVKDESLYAAGDRAKDSTQLAVLGAREGLLPWSRTKLTTAHLRDAIKAYDSGDREGALWSADLALGLDPTLVEARRIRETITGQRDFRHSRSLLEDAVDRVIKLEIEKDQPAAPATQEDAAPASDQPATTQDAPVESAEAGQSPASSDDAAASVEAAVPAESADMTADAAPTPAPAAMDAQADVAADTQASPQGDTDGVVFIPPSTVTPSKSAKAVDVNDQAALLKAMEQWIDEQAHSDMPAVEAVEAGESDTAAADEPADSQATASVPTDTQE